VPRIPAGSDARSGQYALVEAVADSDDVLVRMTHAEALVLFEWIHRKEDEDDRHDHLGLVDGAERAVLWSISGALESLLVEPFRQDYRDLVEAARAEVRRPGAE
jgi:hypothetical protein